MICKYFENTLKYLKQVIITCVRYISFFCVRIENNGIPRGANLRKTARKGIIWYISREYTTRSQLRSCDFSVSISLSNCEFDVVFAHPLGETRLRRSAALSLGVCFHLVYSRNFWNESSRWIFSLVRVFSAATYKISPEIRAREKDPTSQAEFRLAR